MGIDHTSLMPAMPVAPAAMDVEPLPPTPPQSAGLDVMKAAQHLQELRSTYQQLVNATGPETYSALTIKKELDSLEARTAEVEVSKAQKLASDMKHSILSTKRNLEAAHQKQLSAMKTQLEQAQQHVANIEQQIE
eukprot:6237532-Karenia_brevis.AAC.1